MFLPLKAQEEILERLFERMFLDKKDIDEITERYGVYGDIGALQRSYRRQQAQRFIASLRDDRGVRLAMSVKGGIVFGIGIGFITMMIRYFGSYPEGMSFAILIMNAFVPLLNMWFHQKKYGRK